MKNILLIVIPLFLALSCEAPSGNIVPRTYVIGYMICNSEQETLHRFTPLTEYLGAKLGVRFRMRAIDTVDFSKEADKLDFTHTNSLLYIIMHRNQGVDVLAAERSGSLGTRARGLIIALKRSGIRTVSDLKGKRFGFGPMLGPTSYMAQLDILLKKGIDPENDLRYSIPAGTFKHERVIKGVLAGTYDAGAVPLLDFERMASGGRINRNDFAVVAEGEPIPYCNFAFSQRVDDSFARRFREALTDLRKDDTIEIDGKVVHVLQEAGIDGYENIKDADFDSVRDMARRTNMPPYQRY